MNLLDAYVEEVLSEPKQNEYGWYVEVSYTCWSDKVEHRQLYFKTQEEAAKVTKGYSFLT